MDQKQESSHVLGAGIHRFLIKPISSISETIVTLDQAPDTERCKPYPEDYLPQTFLTGLKPPPLDHTPIPHPINNLHMQLQGLIGQMDRHITSVISSNEQAFLSAYALAMKQVARETQSLRDQLILKSNETSVDQRVVELTKQLAWFQKEALLQQNEKKLLIDKCKGLELKCQLLLEDRKFFQQNAIESKKQQLTLRKVILDKDREQERSQKLQIINKPIERIQLIKKESQGGGNPCLHREHIEQLFSQCDNQFTATLIDNICSYISRFDRILQIQSLDLEQHNKTIYKLKQQLCSERNHLTELQQFFLSCIESMRQHVVKRKFQQANDIPYKRKQTVNTQEENYQYMGNEDRIKVMEMLFTNENLLTQLYQIVFPRTTTAADNNIIQTESELQCEEKNNTKSKYPGSRMPPASQGQERFQMRQTATSLVKNIQESRSRVELMSRQTANSQFFINHRKNLTRANSRGIIQSFNKTGNLTSRRPMSTITADNQDPAGSQYDFSQ